MLDVEDTPPIRVTCQPMGGITWVPSDAARHRRKLGLSRVEKTRMLLTFSCIHIIVLAQVQGVFGPYSGLILARFWDKFGPLFILKIELHHRGTMLDLGSSETKGIRRLGWANDFGTEGHRMGSGGRWIRRDWT